MKPSEPRPATTSDLTAMSVGFALFIFVVAISFGVVLGEITHKLDSLQKACSCTEVKR